jgi:hypothetical protein
MLDFLRHGSGVQWMSFSVVSDGFLCILSLLGETEAGSVGTLVVPAARSGNWCHTSFIEIGRSCGETGVFLTSAG